MPRTYSVESELRAAVTICDGGDAHRAKLLATLNEQHFAGHGSTEVFVRLFGLARNNKPIPSVALLRQDPALSEDAKELLVPTLQPMRDDEEVEALIQQLETFRKLRVIYTGTRSVVENIRDSSADTVETALKALETMMLDARSRAEHLNIVVTNEQAADDVMQQVLSQERPDRIRTGFATFDDAAGGFARKQLVLIAATTGGGKSVMAEQLGINAYVLDRRNVALVSFEMDEEEIYARLISNLTGIPFERIYMRRLTEAERARCDQMWLAFKQHGAQHGCKFTIWCPSMEMTPAQIGQILKPGCYDMVLIDYVGLVDNDKKAALWENLGDITRAFKLTANQQRAVYVVFAQLDEETNKVKYAKAMRHHAAYVWQWNYGEEQEETGQVTVTQDKARHCKRFPFDILADFSLMRFTDVRGGIGAVDMLNIAAPPPSPTATSPKPPTAPAGQVPRRFKDRLAFRFGNVRDVAVEANEL